MTGDDVQKDSEIHKTGMFANVLPGQRARYYHHGVLIYDLAVLSLSAAYLARNLHINYRHLLATFCG